MGSVRREQMERSTWTRKDWGMVVEMRHVVCCARRQSAVHPSPPSVLHTLEMVRAGLHWSLRMSRQIPPAPHQEVVEEWDERGLGSHGGGGDGDNATNGDRW